MAGFCYHEGRREQMPTATAPVLDRLDALVSAIHSAEGFADLVAALKEGHGATVDGAWGSSAALALAALARLNARPLLLVIAHPRDLDSWAADLHSFAGVRPVVFPAWDSLPGDDLTVDETATQRLRLLSQLEGDEAPRLILATFQALMQPVPDRDQLAATRRRLAVGDTCDLQELSGWLEIGRAHV